ncbi:FAD dependent oxidoreductase [Roseovarius sp. EC-HK134]|uniref:NAD(P)/FAD-dependent oxidoreductase n=1 Tax=unclassified Roseovarius TaxID=2614913 RepID=UPI00125C1888|nr:MULTISPECIES: FAD-dependent oxidoreductase [unclassified Roseovarius]VVT24859.1 FAD dependent oxidoreductase [Roseovarius sp. EC-SD190]VVT25120.1 FAD dependent oxidoreductase [Roseovarius sp. EC-HK134]
MARSDIIVIGAGIIGVTSALALQREGHRVRILDRKGVAAETSRGNAGAFAYTDIEPLATPGILRKAPKWLLDPLGPLSIPPAYALPLLPWMLRFWRASWQDRYAAAVAAQASLMHHSRAALERLIANVDGEPLMRREGQLQVYEGEAAYRASLPAWTLRRQHGVRFDLLESPNALAEIQPGLSPRFTHAGYTPDWMNTVDPARWTEYLAQQFVAVGGVIETADIRALRQAGDGVEIETATGTTCADQVVLAAGAWSHHLARTLGDAIPLETERGYNTTFSTASFDLRTHLTFADHGFVVSKIGEGLRVGGAVELGGLRLAPNYKRSETLLRKARDFLPGFDPQGGTQWMGFRPSLPDSLPIISRAPRADRVIYAFGHGHLGLTQSAGTAELVAALAAHRDPAIELQAFDAARF